MRHQFTATVAATLITVAAPAAAVGQGSPQPFKPKSEPTAVALSLLGTVVPIALGAVSSDQEGSMSSLLLFYGVYFGPGTGYFYAGRSGRVLAGAGMRLGIGLVALVAVVASCGDDWLFGCDDSGAANAAAILGLGGMAASALYDIVSAGRAVREWNARHEAPRVTLTPRIDPATRSRGLAVRVTF